jgi:hypothetical protein
VAGVGRQVAFDGRPAAVNAWRNAGTARRGVVGASQHARVPSEGSTQGRPPRRVVGAKLGGSESLPAALMACA